MKNTLIHRSNLRSNPSEITRSNLGLLLRRLHEWSFSGRGCARAFAASVLRRYSGIPEGNTIVVELTLTSRADARGGVTSTGAIRATEMTASAKFLKPLDRLNLKVLATLPPRPDFTGMEALYDVHPMVRC